VTLPVATLPPDASTGSPRAATPPAYKTMRTGSIFAAPSASAGMSLRASALVLDDEDDQRFFDGHSDPGALESFERFCTGPADQAMRPPSWHPDADAEGEVLAYVFAK
jgi:hypothetical protein